MRVSILTPCCKGGEGAQCISRCQRGACHERCGNHYTIGRDYMVFSVQLMRFPERKPICEETGSSNTACLSNQLHNARACCVDFISRKQVSSNLRREREKKGCKNDALSSAHFSVRFKASSLSVGNKSGDRRS